MNAEHYALSFGIGQSTGIWVRNYSDKYPRISDNHYRVGDKDKLVAMKSSTLSQRTKNEHPDMAALGAVIDITYHRRYRSGCDGTRSNFGG